MNDTDHCLTSVVKYFKKDNLYFMRSGDIPSEKETMPNGKLWAANHAIILFFCISGLPVT